VEPRRPARHIFCHPVEAGQAADDLVAIAVAVRLGQAAQIAHDVGEHQPGQVRVLQSRRQHALDRRIRAVPEFGELIDRLPVPVPRQAPGPRRVLQSVQYPVVGQVVQPFPQVNHGRRVAVVRGCQFVQYGRHVIGVGLRYMHPAQPVHRAQHPQVREGLVPAGEVE
jgi:hypothetical protein